MVRKTVDNKRRVAAKQDGSKKPATARVRKYLSPKFAKDLVDHMHRAKKAVLEARS